MKDFQVTASTEFILHNFKAGKKYDLWHILVHVFDKLGGLKLISALLQRLVKVKALLLSGLACLSGLQDSTHCRRVKFCKQCWSCSCREEGLCSAVPQCAWDWWQWEGTWTLKDFCEVLERFSFSLLKAEHMNRFYSFMFPPIPAQDLLWHILQYCCSSVTKGS